MLYAKWQPFCVGLSVINHLWLSPSKLQLKTLQWCYLSITMSKITTNVTACSTAFQDNSIEKSKTPRYRPFWGNSSLTSGCPSQRAINAESVFMSLYLHEFEFGGDDQRWSEYRHHTDECFELQFKKQTQEQCFETLFYKISHYNTVQCVKYTILQVNAIDIHVIASN